MSRFPRLALLALAASVTLQADPVRAAECTDAEWQSSQSIWSWAATTSACAQYAIGDSFVSAPCSATSCVSVMEQVGEQLPDCTVSGVNNKIEVQNAMTVCNNEDIIATDAPFVTPATAAPLVTSAPISTSAPLETLTPGTTESTTSTPTFASTDGSLGSGLDSALTSGSSSAPSPAATSSTTSCTTSEVSSLVSLFTDAAKSSSCAADATVSTYSVYIFTKCVSSCAPKLKLLANDLPNCYYDYESSNKKAALLNEIDGCGYSTYISTTVFLSTGSATSDAASYRSTAFQFGQALALVLFAGVGALLHG
jgi:hypothetical protein